MKLLSLQQNSQRLQYQPHFQANPKIAQEKLLKGISENLMSNALKNGDIVELTSIINDPKKNKVFFATLGSLMVAAATKITELLTGGDKSENDLESGDVIELSKKEDNVTVAEKSIVEEKTAVLTKDIDVEESLSAASLRIKNDIAKEPEKPKFMIHNNDAVVKISRHMGMPTAKEKALELGINDVSERLSLELENKNSLVSLYNKFCGLNYKGVSYNNLNEEISNSELSQSLTSQLGLCLDKESLLEIINKYNTYSSEKFEQPIVQESVIEIPVEVPNVIATRDNIKNAYVSLDEDARQSVNEFLDYVSNQDSILQKKVLQKINKDYSDCLPEIATINCKLEQLAKVQNRKNGFLSLLSNGLIAKEALKTYFSDDTAKEFSFNEYNSLIYNNCSEDSIKALAKMRNKGEISSITMNYADNSFELNFYNRFVGSSFKTILKAFKAINKSSSRGLQSYEQDYKIEDIEKEISSAKETYPLLWDYLYTKTTKCLNKGKETQLLKIYEGAFLNKDLFTLHSYLRFLERYVMPEFQNSSEKIYASLIKAAYMSKVSLLKDSIMNSLQKPVKVYEYTVEEVNIKAPKIKVPFGDGDDFFEITINDAGKIHTIF